MTTENPQQCSLADVPLTGGSILLRAEVEGRGIPVAGLVADLARTFRLPRRGRQPAAIVPEYGEGARVERNGGR
ncbi:hypothetical protein AB0465_37585 [Streptomyces griseoviridis]|uniref:hypothetical protein n=1 Tax=Streptomyces griseoviridis TaxID=45398 RepID=UPI003402A481